MKKGSMMVRIYCVIFSMIILTLYPSFLFADAPLSLLDYFEVSFSENKKFVAETNDELNTTVYSINADGTRSKLWEIKNMYRGAELSNDGKFLAIPYGGLNLLPIDYAKNEIVLKMAKEGTIIWEIRLNDLIEDFNSLQRTSSHYYWGDYIGFNNKNQYIIETVEKNRFAINIETGEFSKEN